MEEKDAIAGQVLRMEEVMRRVQMAQASDSSTDLDQLQQIFRELQNDYPEEYVMYNLSAIALTQVKQSLQCMASFL